MGIGPGKSTLDSYDDELCTAMPTDPKVLAEIEEMEKRIQDQKPSAANQERLARIQEENRNSVSNYRWEGQERWQGRENEESRLTRIMSCDEFVRRLNANGVRVFLNDWSARGLVGVNVYERGPWEVCSWGEYRIQVPRTVAILQYPYGPEWSIMRFDEYGLPTKEKYHGWRTALLGLIRNEVLIEEKAHEIFGMPYGPASLYYRQQLQCLRQIRMGLAI